MKPYPLPDPQKQPDAFLVLLYKTLKRVEFNDRAWDKIFFPRCMKRIQELVAILDDDHKAAALCLKELAEKYNDACLDWTVETIISHSFEWKAEKFQKSERECFQRLIGAYAGGDPKGLTKLDPMGIIAAVAGNQIKMLAPAPMKEPESMQELSDEDRAEAARVFAEAKAKLKEASEQNRRV